MFSRLGSRKARHLAIRRCPVAVPPHAALCTACQGIRSHPVPVALVGGVLHPRRVEGRPPAALVVLSRLQVVALAVHPYGNVANATPVVEPGAERPESAVVRGQRAGGESDGSTEEPTALVQHATRLPGRLAARSWAGSSGPSALAVLRLI